MTIAFVRNRPISKAKGESAGSLFAYINRVDGWETKANLDETVIPYDSKPPHGFDNMQQVFMDADTYERSNGVVAKELTIAVPKELNVDEARELMFKICQQYEETRYLSAVTHHNDHNPHIHLLLLERQRDGVDRPKEQFFKRYNSSKSPEETGTPKFPNAATDRREFLANARQIVESETNKILERKGLKLISFDAQNDNTILPPAPHLGAKLYQPMLRALAQKELDPNHDPAILKHPKVIRYLERQEAQELLNQAETMQELANNDKQELAKPVHQAQLKQANNANKMQQALAAQQAQKQAETERVNREFAAIQAAYKQRDEALKQQKEAQKEAEAQALAEAELFEKQEAEAIANNAKLLQEQETQQAPQEQEKAPELEQVKQENLGAWGQVLGANSSAQNAFNEYAKLTGAQAEKRTVSDHENQQELPKGIDKGRSL